MLLAQSISFVWTFGEDSSHTYVREIIHEDVCVTGVWGIRAFMQARKVKVPRIDNMAQAAICSAFIRTMEN